MKKITLLLFCFVTLASLQAQTLDADLKAKQAEVAAAEAALAALQGEADALAAQIEKNAGWVTGYSGLVGFDFNRSNNWISSPNRDARSSSLNIGLTGFANNIKEDFFWRNKGQLSKSWQDIDLSAADRGVDGDGLFSNGTIDVLNISSLAGKPISDTWAVSGLGELNTSLQNFLSPGTLDLGLGLTWTPNIDDLIVVIHPLNYHVAFSGVDAASTSGALGAKIRADFNRAFDVGGKSITWNSTLTSFFPYSDTDQIIPAQFDDDHAITLLQEEFEAGLFEYTWLNTLTFEIWNGIGVGLSHGLRNADFESPDIQNFFTVGLSYTL